VRNAIRHGRGAPVTVRESAGALEVRDEGPGIDAAALERVFDPFWRGVASGGPERSPPGQGLGLTIAERLCAAAGWSLSIESDRGRGTCVRVDLGTAAA
jgi:signal transduction histidine kinase